MKMLSIFFVATLMSVACFAQVSSPTPSASPVLAMVGPAPLATPAPVASPAVELVAEPAAPPQWAQTIMVEIQSLPVVGPIITKAMLYVGIIGSILTALVAFLLSVLSAVSGIAGLSGLANIQAWVQNFKSSKVMYWITYFSNFNAQKPSAPTGSTILKS